MNCNQNVKDEVKNQLRQSAGISQNPGNASIEKGLSQLDALHVLLQDLSDPMYIGKNHAQRFINMRLAINNALGKIGDTALLNSYKAWMNKNLFKVEDRDARNRLIAESIETLGLVDYVPQRNTGSYTTFISDNMTMLMKSDTQVKILNGNDGIVNSKYIFIMDLMRVYTDSFEEFEEKGSEDKVEKMVSLIAKSRSIDEWKIFENMSQSVHINGELRGRFSEAIKKHFVPSNFNNETMAVLETIRTDAGLPKEAFPFKEREICTLLEEKGIIVKDANGGYSIKKKTP